MITTHNQKEKCILVVDDSSDNLCLMEFILKSQGYQVSLANNGKEAINKLKKCHLDLVLLDVMMPNMNGYEVVERLRKDKSLSSIPVYLVTADKYISWYEAISAGANGLIHKPIDIDELLSQVEQVFNQSQPDFNLD